MFINQAYTGKTDWWRYLIGILIVFFAWQIIGMIPLFAALFLELGPEALLITDQNDLFKALDSNTSFFLVLLSFAVGFAGLLLVIRYLHQQKLVDATTVRKKIDWGRFFFGFGIIAVFLIVPTIIDYNLQPEHYVWNFQLEPFLVLAAIAVVMIPLQTSFEEYLFRGYLMQGIGVRAGNKWVPLVLTSVIFGGLHLFNPEVGKLGYIIMVYYIGTGLLLGIITLMDDGMELALGFHAGNNLVGVLLVTTDWTAFQTHSVLKDISEPSAGLDILIPVFVLYPIFLIIMAKVYKWHNWREKLFGKVIPPPPPVKTLNYSEEI